MDAILLDAVTKTYRVGVGRARVREMLPPPVDRAVSRTFPRWWSRNTLDALDGVSLRISPGSSVGIVGHNGAGKTTLLKVVAGVTSPTSGRMAVRGRIAALIDVLVGFNLELTGRENAYLLGAMHGLSRRAMAPRIEGILAFAEIDELADTPLKRYSAGMGARLAFATLRALDVEILLIDEVLAVGDASFQRKCIRWLDEYRESGGTLVFVSHNLGLVRNMTRRVVWMDHGRVADDGEPAKVLARYATAMERRDSEPAHLRRRQAKRAMVARGLHRWGAGGVRVEAVHVMESTSPREGVEIDIAYESAELNEAIFCVGFVDDGGREVAGSVSQPLRLGQRNGSVQCRIEPVPLRSGIYFPVVAILSADGLVRDRWRLDRAIVVDGDGRMELPDDLGPVTIPAQWSGLEVSPGPGEPDGGDGDGQPPGNGGQS